MRCRVCGRRFAGGQHAEPSGRIVWLGSTKPYCQRHGVVTESLCWGCLCWVNMNGYLLPARRH